MSQSEKVLSKIKSSIVEVAEAVAFKDYEKEFDICRCFDFLFSLYASEKELEERPNFWAKQQAEAWEAAHQENGWYFGDTDFGFGH